ncbi:GNAT family N-acetyltransferase [Streptomyces sp. NPDC059568]|uniref:GNAT family N-acetyltransferase n=1 Tax=Streptomyces sp. NPDC059568 TaxID=3346868 RepID=UPI003680336A
MTHTDVGRNEDGSRSRSADGDVLDRIDHYQDALPRLGARVEDFGPLTLFVRDGAGPPLHARPTRGWSGRPVGTADVERVRARQRELGVPEAFEWIAESAPELRAAAEAAGLTLDERPLLVLPEDARVPTEAVRNVPTGIAIRTLTADDPSLATAVATPYLAFAELGTQIGTTGTEELAEAVRTHTTEIARTATRIRTGRTTVVAAVEHGIALSSGLLPGSAVGVTEICAIATLPTARRQGLALAVTAALTTEARALGLKTIFLCATDKTVARIYTRLGFQHTATFLAGQGRGT